MKPNYFDMNKGRPKGDLCPVKTNNVEVKKLCFEGRWLNGVFAHHVLVV